MPYLTQLTDRAAVYRPAVATGETGQKLAALAAVGGMDAVWCKLLDQGQQRLLRTFGTQVQADAVVLFPAGTDIRPGLSQTDGKNDRLIITHENGATSKWLVKAVKDPASMRKMIVAAVVRSAF